MTARSGAARDVPLCRSAPALAVRGALSSQRVAFGRAKGRVDRARCVRRRKNGGAWHEAVRAAGREMALPARGFRRGVVSSYYVLNQRGGVAALQGSELVAYLGALRARWGLGTYCGLIVARAEGVSTSLRALLNSSKALQVPQHSRADPRGNGAGVAADMAPPMLSSVRSGRPQPMGSSRGSQSNCCNRPPEFLPRSEGRRDQNFLVAAVTSRASARPLSKCRDGVG
jgi:hypothetical protein